MIDDLSGADVSAFGFERKVSGSIPGTGQFVINSELAQVWSSGRLIAAACYRPPAKTHRQAI